ncbi:hypothetical protein IW261DRAFT_1640530 [Armillaria novae-zelandiae]|uniref:Uncharacterized protein n=1 Tax=Armillaria novae-zelandiae TaxID=153914 RepID=A0AA39PRY0_9AGAR|nr:hypothetical protein IW261DRAFT_1640530 [Armillaria novae-zelandiae]
MPKPGKGWRRLADAPEGQWGNTESPADEAKYYTPAVEAEICLTRPLCVGLGEIGLDYHYTRSPQDVQKTVFAQQLKLVVEKGQPLTIHTRKAEENTERAMKEIIPKDHPVHVPLPHRLARLCPPSSLSLPEPPHRHHRRRDVLNQFEYGGLAASDVLETDAPYMVPSNVYHALLADPTLTEQARLPLSHSLMIPFTAQYVASVLGGAWDMKGY